MARRLLVFFLENMNIFMMFIFAFLVTCSGVALALTGEATVSTFWHCKRFINDTVTGVRVPPNPRDMTPGLLHRLQPRAKLLLVLRDPVTRSGSYI